MYALGIPYMDENVKAKVTPMYAGIFVASGICGELPWWMIHITLKAAETC